ncbi:hypothetical protein KM043_009155 [Ampulex compressa]|nr:hypothetical protein KM043_009155 [Ampulex compressa]
MLQLQNRAALLTTDQGATTFQWDTPYIPEREESSASLVKSYSLDVRRASKGPVSWGRSPEVGGNKPKDLAGSLLGSRASLLRDGGSLFWPIGCIGSRTISLEPRAHAASCPREMPSTPLDDVLETRLDF